MVDCIKDKEHLVQWFSKEVKMSLSGGIGKL